MSAVVETTIRDMELARDLMLRALANTPDDRLHWSPSPTARTPLRLVAHSSYSLGFILTMLKGTPYPAPTMAEADAGFMEMDGNVKTREEAISLLESKSADMLDYLRSIPDEDLDRLVALPFKLGEAPLHAVMGAGPLHTRTHLAQLEYLQTIYGDRNW